MCDKDKAIAYISKERLQYLEYLEKNIATLINNAVIELVETEKRKDYEKKRVKRGNMSTIC